MKNQELLMKAALYYGLDVYTHRDIFGFYVVLGGKRYHFRMANTPLNNSGSLALARDKYSVLSALRDARLPAPKGTYFEPNEFATNNIDVSMLTYPLVCKPGLDTSSGTGVVCNIESREELMLHLGRLLKRHAYVCVEEFKANLNSYRVLVIDGKIAGVVFRKPAQVVGDGVHSILELIQIENEKKVKQKEQTGVSMSLIKLNDPELPKRLKEQRLTLDSIPSDGRHVWLVYVCNSTRGGTIHSMGQEICEENARLCIDAAHVLGLNIVGFDVICKNINQPIAETEGWFIEANYNPDLTIHEVPHTGPSTPVANFAMRAFIRQHRFSYMASKVKEYTPMLTLFGSIISVFVIHSLYVA